MYARQSAYKRTAPEDPGPFKGIDLKSILTEELFHRTPVRRICVDRTAVIDAEEPVDDKVVSGRNAQTRIVRPVVAGDAVAPFNQEIKRTGAGTGELEVGGILRGVAAGTFGAPDIEVGERSAQNQRPIDERRGGCAVRGIDPEIGVLRDVFVNLEGDLPPGN